MPRVLLLATTTGYQTRAFGEAAERLGVDLVFATDRCNVLEDPWMDAALPIRFHDEAASTAAIVAAAATNPVDGIIAVGDRPTTIAARAAEALRLPGHPPDATRIARSKLLTRERLRDAGLPVPWFQAVSVSAGFENPAEAGSHWRSTAFPCVVKPAALSGSRGVMRVNDERELVAAFYRLRALLQAPDIRSERTDLHDVALIEGFIEGREFALEGLMTDGALQTLAIFDKPDPLDGPFFEETIYLTPSAAPAGSQHAMIETVARAAAAIGLSHGPIHAECRVNPRGVFVLEVAARPIGGLCARALRFERAETAGLKACTTTVDTCRPDLSASARPNEQASYGGRAVALREGGQVGRNARAKARAYIPVTSTDMAISLEELLLRHALGEPATGWQRETAASGVMMIPIPRRGVFRGVAGLDEARSVPGIDDIRITAKPDQMLIPLPEGASYLGFIFARADTPQAADQALRAAHGRLAFAIDPEVPVLQSVHG
jgi:hypothetical protein